MKYIIAYFYLFLAISSYGQSETRNYCTEIGQFDLTFYNQEAGGTYIILPKQRLGSIWGILKSDTLHGRWHDADGKGSIVILFNQDKSWFRADYNNDKEPEKWYKDGWHASLRPDDESSFEINGIKYNCE